MSDELTKALNVYYDLAVEQRRVLQEIWDNRKAGDKLWAKSERILEEFELFDPMGPIESRDGWALQDPGEYYELAEEGAKRPPGFDAFAKAIQGGLMVTLKRYHQALEQQHALVKNIRERIKELNALAGRASSLLETLDDDTAVDVEEAVWKAGDVIETDLDSVLEGSPAKLPKKADWVAKVIRKAHR